MILTGTDPLRDDEKEDDDNLVKIKSIFQIILYIYRMPWLFTNVVKVVSL